MNRFFLYFLGGSAIFGFGCWGAILGKSYMDTLVALFTIFGALAAIIATIYAIEKFSDWRVEQRAALTQNTKKDMAMLTKRVSTLTLELLSIVSHNYHNSKENINEIDRQIAAKRDEHKEKISQIRSHLEMLKYHQEHQNEVKLLEQKKINLLFIGRAAELLYEYMRVQDELSFSLDLLSVVDETKHNDFVNVQAILSVSQGIVSAVRNGYIKFSSQDNFILNYHHSEAEKALEQWTMNGQPQRFNCLSMLGLKTTFNLRTNMVLTDLFKKTPPYSSKNAI